MIYILFIYIYVCMMYIYICIYIFIYKDIYTYYVNLKEEVFLDFDLIYQ